MRQKEAKVKPYTMEGGVKLFVWTILLMLLIVMIFHWLG